METQGQRRAGDKGAGNASLSARKMTVIWNLANVPPERKVRGPNEKARPVCQGKGWREICSWGLVLDPPHCLMEVRGSGIKSPEGVGTYSREATQKLLPHFLMRLLFSLILK